MLVNVCFCAEPFFVQPNTYFFCAIASNGWYYCCNENDNHTRNGMYFTLITSMEITWHGLWSENHTLLSMNYVTTEIARTKPGMITSHTSVFAV